MNITKIINKIQGLICGSKTRQPHLIHRKSMPGKVVILYKNKNLEISLLIKKLKKRQKAKAQEKKKAEKSPDNHFDHLNRF